MRILWLSRHGMLPSQKQAMHDLYPNSELEIVQDSRLVNAEHIAQRLDSGEFNDLAFVGPMSVLYALCRHGIRPLRATMNICSEEESEVKINNRFYKFMGFKRVEAVLLVLSDPMKGGVEVACSNYDKAQV